VRVELTCCLGKLQRIIHSNEVILFGTGWYFVRKDYYIIEDSGVHATSLYTILNSTRLKFRKQTYVLLKEGNYRNLARY
jgi:hypothetical protein